MARTKTKEKIDEVVDVGFQRFKGETFDLREFVMPNTLMVKKAAEGRTPVECYNFVVIEIKYPYREKLPKGLDILVNLFADLHILFRHPPRPKLSFAPLDFWKLPNETLRDNVGDCEDSSFLTASLMRAAGASTSEVYAVIGTVEISGMHYGHAWVEYDGKILETTYDIPPEVYPETKDLYGSVYFPEIRFNDEKVEALYYPKTQKAFSLDTNMKEYILKKQKIPKLRKKKLRKALEQESFKLQ